MKKVVLAALAVMAFGVARAQDEDQVIAVKGGFNFSNFGGDVTTDGKTGFYLGVAADMPVAGNFHIQPELLYSSEGADHQQGIGYFRIPVMAKYYVIKGLSIEAGPQFGFKVTTQNDNVDNNTKSFDYGIGAGAAYEFSMGIFVEARYNAGIANISEDSQLNVTTHSFQIGLGYRFE